MLNYIIPPIVIVLGLAALIFFLFKKTARIPEEAILVERKNSEKGVNSDKKKIFRFTQFMLQISEKGMQYFKLISLKFYNKTDNWFHSIKEKREKRLDEKTVKVIEIKKPEPEKVMVVEEKEKIFSDGNKIIEEKEIEVRPMISEEIIRPDSTVGFRNEFERALIERIALNPRDIEAYERLGDYYIEVGNFNDSLSCFEQVLKLSPVNRKAKIKTKRLQKIVYNNFSE